MAVLFRKSRRLDAYVPSLVGVDSAREVGIRGSDVFVGITDTGLNLYHDQFDHDERDIFPETITCDHGTHVAGLLAGSSFSGKHANLGIVDKARIEFMDIGTQSETCAGQLHCALTSQRFGRFYL
ncbi:uncharacterized protein PITG_12629 [Phytophthora infestans T30-4]|uniref:subtilisin n=1 Tax=Phytophthora infestans (strain T30-4) TaxID=403677 RepID=D0NNE7_PHYIT|nr:uncharacterized protein PITG_12629 [Phytophthora infestans T30-4]EEY62083.1 conserved hypothetical protein [Phytophthora infestans T30-4]|eukprot:XP_002899387.1 conserved hypothetical protein [Phytophthora infestans T30-4]